MSSRILVALLAIVAIGVSGKDVPMQKAIPPLMDPIP